MSVLTARRERLVVLRNQMQLASLLNKLRLWNGSWIENDATGESIPLFQLGSVSGLHYTPAGQAYLSTTSGSKWISLLCQHHLYSSDGGQRVYSRVPGETEWIQENVALSPDPQWLPSVPITVKSGIVQVQFRIARSRLPVGGTQ
eukprot:6148550-Amphidinium_carterae.1